MHTNWLVNSVPWRFVELTLCVVSLDSFQTKCLLRFTSIIHTQ